MVSYSGIVALPCFHAPVCIGIPLSYHAFIDISTVSVRFPCPVPALFPVLNTVYVLLNNVVFLDLFFQLAISSVKGFFLHLELPYSSCMTARLGSLVRPPFSVPLLLLHGVSGGFPALPGMRPYPLPCGMLHKQVLSFGRWQRASSAPPYLQDVLHTLNASAVFSFSTFISSIRLTKSAYCSI